MKINEFFTSDHHIGHKNILKFCPNRAQTLDAMYKKIITRHNSVVRKNDVCWFLGDAGMNSFDELKEVLSKMNGRKIMILGNHDKKENSMYNAGFDAVMYNATKIISGQVVSLSHCPLLGVRREDTSDFKNGNPEENWHGELRDKYRKFTMINNGQFHLHGHLHGPNNGKSKVKDGRQWDIGLDGNNMTPVSKSQVESWIVKTLLAEKLALENKTTN